MDFIVIIIIALILFMLWWWWPDDVEGSYQAIEGHERTKNTEQIVTKLKRKKKKRAKDYMILGDVQRYNMGDTIDADYNYALGLQQAEYEEDPVIFHINDRLNPDVPVVTPNVDIYKVTVTSDPQNVHDTNVVRKMAERYRIISRSGGASVDTIAKFLSTLNQKQRRIAEDILNREEELSTIGDTDSNVLRMVINRGEHIWPSLASNLERCQMENAHGLVCLTGRVSQIMDSLTLLDDEAGAPIISEAIIRKEMVDTAANYVKNLNEEQSKLYEEGEDIDQLFEPLETQLRAIYTDRVDSGVLNKLIEEVHAGF